MKKLVLTLAIVGFVTFGALSIQNLIASSFTTEMVNYDKDPKKEDTKKAADTKEVKSDTKEVKSVDAKSSGSCASSCADKSASSKSCCSGEKSGCSTTCTPDKK